MESNEYQGHDNLPEITELEGEKILGSIQKD